MTGETTGVLHLIDTYRIGGPGKTIINSARFIDPRFRIHVASFVPGDALRNEFISAVQHAGIPCLQLAERRRVDPKHFSLLRDYIRDHRIRILHTHGYRSDVTGYLMSMMVRGLKLVTTHHGWIRTNWRQSAIARFATALSGRFDGMYCVSRRLFEELPRSVVRRAESTVIHNGVVLQDYSERGVRLQTRAGLGLGANDVLIAVIGRLSAEKGVEHMLRAFTRIAPAHPSAHLAFVGEGPLRGSLEREAANSGLGARIRFLDHRHPIQPFYEATDVIVCPSLTEGLSNVLLEAMAFQRAVVATRAGGNAEIIEDGLSGLLVPVGDVEALAKAVSAVAGSPARRDCLARGGYARVVREFSFEARMKKEEQFYDRVLNGR